MTARTAIIVCPESESGRGTGRPLLGLTVGERLLLALSKNKVERVIFAGEGPRPTCARAGLDEVPLDALETGETVWMLPADLVLDAGLLNEGADRSLELPFASAAQADAAAIAADPGSWLARLGPGAAGERRGFAVRVTSDEAARSAEKSLIRSLTKDADGVVSRNLNRKISTAISRRLVRFPIHPNHITAFVLLVGICSFPFAAAGTYLGFVLGGFCYWFSAVLDGCDGEVSRLKHLGTPLGAWLDTVVDDVVGLAYAGGMYLGLARGAEHPYWGWIGGAAVAFYLLTILPRYYVMATRLGSGDYQRLAKQTRPSEARGARRAALALRDVVFRTDFLPFAAFVTALVTAVPIFAVSFAVGAVASAADSLVKLASFGSAQRTK